MLAVVHSVPSREIEMHTTRRRSALAAVLAVTAGLSLSATAAAADAPAPLSAKEAPHAVPAPKAATGERTVTRKERRMMRKAFSARSAGATSGSVPTAS